MQPVPDGIDAPGTAAAVAIEVVDPIQPPRLVVPVPIAESSTDPVLLAQAGSARPGTPSDIVVTGRNRVGDPLVELNAQSFEAAQKFDEAVFGPVARAYGTSVPRPIRKGLRNFLTNLREPIVAANYVLQLKIGKAGETLGRFVINSTIGVAGVFDQAKRKPFNLPRRRNGFANTMGFYGVKPGPFFYLPLIGPTTLRDIFGNIVDSIASPVVTVKPFDRPEYIVPIGVLSALDARNEFEEETQALRATADPYATRRKFYLERRQSEIDALRTPRRTAVPIPSVTENSYAPAR